MSQGNMGGLLTEVAYECERATQMHGPLNSAHEAYAVLFEEVDELWDEVKKKASDRDPEAMREELIQIAAVALRTITDVIGE